MEHCKVLPQSGGGGKEDEKTEMMKRNDNEEEINHLNYSQTESVVVKNNIIGAIETNGHKS